METELLEFRDLTQGWQALVHRALTAGIPASRIARLTGLDPQKVGRLSVRPRRAERGARLWFEARTASRTLTRGGAGWGEHVAAEPGRSAVQDGGRAPCPPEVGRNHRTPYSPSRGRSGRTPGRRLAQGDRSATRSRAVPSPTPEPIDGRLPLARARQFVGRRLAVADSGLLSRHEQS
ncbi:DUF6003 family protein [Streptomyces sp. NPDC058695]|uniref:DUF6003 family protein n=1 Tax=Streptomyces sp. NPDC058695 TaxID=3346604 RepID=UPI0036671328